MLDMISSQRQTEQTNSSQGPSSNTIQSHTGLLEPEQGSTTATEAAPTAMESTEVSSTAMDGGGVDAADSKVLQLQQTKVSSSADNTNGGANNSSPPGHASSKSASGPEKVVADGAESVAESAENDTTQTAGPQSVTAQPSPADSQQSEQAYAAVPAADGEGDKQCQASCSNQATTHGGNHGDGQHRATNVIGSASCQSNTSGEQQPQQADQENGAVEMDSKAPKTPSKKVPKKGGLVNVQRSAVKGYSIHRLASRPCRGCLSCAGVLQKTVNLQFITAICMTMGLIPDCFLTGT